MKKLIKNTVKKLLAPIVKEVLREQMKINEENFVKAFQQILQVSQC
jgi:glutamyl-tRNA reductase